MSKFVVIVFNDEKAAYEGSRALAELDGEGSVTLYAAAVVTKDADGSFQIKEAADEGPMGMATGMLLGTMIGALGGAVGAAAGAAAGAAVGGGMAAGMAGGALTGWVYDVYNLGVDSAFLDDVGAQLTSGKSAVVAEVTEGWTTPLDSRMESIGGTVLRRYRIDVEDDQIERDIEATSRDLEELDEEWDQAVGDTKAKLQAKRDAAKARLETLRQRAEKKAAALKEEVDAKLAKLGAQISKAKDDHKTRFEKSRDELKASYEARMERLKEASRKIKESVA